MTQPAQDVIVIHTARRIVTMQSGVQDATAVAVRGARIVAVGTLPEVRAALGDEPHIVDDSLANNVILPGLIDQHLHPILGASTLATEVIATEDWVLPDRTYPAAHSPRAYASAPCHGRRCDVRPRGMVVQLGLSRALARRAESWCPRRRERNPPDRHLAAIVP